MAVRVIGKRRKRMFHPSYFEPKAQMYRASERAHMAHRCDECGREQVCPEAFPVMADDYRECRFAGCQGGTLFPNGIILCGMCY
jgi:hypothetical protein